MSNLNVRFDVNFSARFVRLALIGAMLLASASELASESVTLTTYYPAPSGVYTQLIATSNSFMARDAGYLGIGTNNPDALANSKMTIDVSAGGFATALAVQNRGQRNFALNPLAGGGWQMYDGGGNAWNARITDSGGNIGIGTSSPASALSVNGGVQVGDDVSTCPQWGGGGVKQGTLRYHWWSGLPEICTYGGWTPLLTSTQFSVYNTFLTGIPINVAQPIRCPNNAEVVMAEGVWCWAGGQAYVGHAEWFPYSGVAYYICGPTYGAYTGQPNVIVTLTCARDGNTSSYWSTEPTPN